MKRKSLPTGRDFLFVEGYGNENPGAFQSTRPLRGATSDHPWRNLWAWVFQPTRPLRGATRTPIKLRDCFLISTHAPLAGRDRSSIKVTINKRDFNPRAPCGARPRHIQRFARAFYFNPRAPCGARRSITTDGCGVRIHFNPRAPCGARLMIPLRFSGFTIFQPTRPLRGATGGQGGILSLSPYFNPRAPCGARQQKCTNHYAHFCDNRQISDAFAQNAACQGILLLFDAGKPCGFWVRTAQVISARLCFAL